MEGHLVTEFTCFAQKHYLRFIEGFMKWLYEVRGAHTHIRVFMNGAACGNLTFRNEEFALVKEHCPWITFVKIEEDFV